MVAIEESPFLFTRAPTVTAGNDFFYFYDPSPCSLIIGNPVIYFTPFDQLNGAGLISQPQSLLFSTFSTWSGVDDITLDDSAIHQYQQALRCNQYPFGLISPRGVDFAKPVQFGWQDY